MAFASTIAGFLALLCVIAFSLKALMVKSDRIDFDGLGKALFVAALIAGAWGGLR